MMRKLSFACLCAALGTAVTFAQASRESVDATANAGTTTGTSPSAWVYVVEVPNGGHTSTLNGYQASADGKLTPLPGSPLATFPGGSIAVNGKYVIVPDESDQNIAAYTIGSNGALTLSHVTDASASAPGCEGMMWGVLDHTGADFYSFGWASEGCNDWSALSFSVDKSNGQLDYLNSAGNDQTFTAWQQVPLTFPGDNKFAYGSGEVNGVQSIAGFKRNSNGSLTALSFQSAMPKPKSGTTYDLLNSEQADPNGNLAAGVIEVLHTSSGIAWGETQLAVYSADSSGKLTTTGTHANMPETLTGGIDSMSMSPSGKLLAVSGNYGLRIFHFNGSKPITPFTGFMSHPVSGGGLYVFTVTPTSFSVAPGSPYTGNNNIVVESMAVQTLPRYK